MAFTSSESGSGDTCLVNFFDQLARKDSGPLIAAVMQVSRLFMLIQTEHPENGRVDVMDMHRAFLRPHADVIGSPNILSGLCAAAGHEHGEAPGIVIAPVALLVERGAAEFPAPDHERIFEHSALLQIRE